MVQDLGIAPKVPGRPDLGADDPAELQDYFVKSGRYTAGVGTHYPPETFLTAQATYQVFATDIAVRPTGHRRNLGPGGDDHGADPVVAAEVERDLAESVRQRIVERRERLRSVVRTIR
jgi:hypothetical protein